MRKSYPGLLQNARVGFWVHIKMNQLFSNVAKTSPRFLTRHAAPLKTSLQGPRRAPVQGSIQGPLKGQYSTFRDVLQDALGDDAETIQSLIDEEGTVTDIVLDAGKSPVVYFSGKDPPCSVSTIPIEKDNIEKIWVAATTLSGSPEMAAVTSRTGTCMSRPLDRLSKMHHLDGSISGLTWRVAMHESVPIPAALQSSLLSSKANTLLYGPPGSGKTTLLRSVAKYCSDTLRERVVVVDATGEIGGYHPTSNILGLYTRRLCVAPGGTHDQAILDAIRNHSPTTIIVDEIVTNADAAAVYSAAARGVRVIATTHATTTHDFITNPIFSLLVGRIKDATVTDARAKTSDGKKCIRERTLPTTFTVAYGVHSETLDTDLSRTIDSML